MEREKRILTPRRVAAGLSAVVLIEAAAGNVVGRSPQTPDYSGNIRYFNDTTLLNQTPAQQASSSYLPSKEDGVTIVIPKAKDIEDFNGKIKKQENLQQEIIGVIKENKGLFNSKKMEDFKMYYPIYQAVSQKYPEVDWYLLWITHEAETGASNSKVAFNGGSYPYYGGMQRNVNIWPQSYVNESFKGLGFLRAIPTRHKSDAMEIAAAAHELSDNIKRYLSLGKDEAVFRALSLYTGGEYLAQQRFGLWEKYKKIFSSIS